MILFISSYKRYGYGDGLVVWAYAPPYDFLYYQHTSYKNLL